MKKIALLGLIILFSCTKEEIKPQEKAIVSVSVSNILVQTVDGNVSTDHSYELKIYEDLGYGFNLTETNTYKDNDFPFIFNNTITTPFYFELVLHNNSTFTTQGNGVINASITYNGIEIIFLEADKNTWSKNYTSSIYNN